MSVISDNPEQTAALNAALAKAQGAFPPIPRDKRVEVTTKTGQRYSFEYAPLEAILKACRPALAENGLAIVQMVEQYEPDGLRLRTELRHADGGAIITSRPLVGSFETPQLQASAETYAKRYALTGILGIAAEEDDDGQSAAGGRVKERPKQSQFAAPAAPINGPPAERPLEERELLADIKARFAQLEGLEDQLGWEHTDWVGWSRAQLKVDADVWLDAGQMRQLLELLEREQAHLIGEIAKQAVNEEVE